jgi:manganese transport protein
MPGSHSHRSLSEAHGTVSVPYHRNLLRRLLAIAGPAFLVCVGYMDPGNWATDLAAGSSFNTSLLWVLAMSNLMALVLQSLAFRLGIARGLDLAQACRAEYSAGINLVLYVLCEIAITACDLAEVIGSAIALQLLFGLPLIWGVLLTASDTFALLFLNHFGIRKIEALILVLITIIAAGMLVQVVAAKPIWGEVAAGLLPTVPSDAALYVAIGMLGATVMPHNLYLHSSLVQTRRIGSSHEAKRQSIRMNTMDSLVALNMAFFVNAAILVVAASVFFRHGYHYVAEIQDAHRLLEPILGGVVAPIAFAVALLASGQSSTITGTLAGQIVMEGFLNLRLPPWVRRMATRLLAIVPAVCTIIYFGERGTGSLLVLSQVVLSLQLPFAIIPMIHFVSDSSKMDGFAIGRVFRVLAWTVAGIIVGLNVKLVVGTFGGWIRASGDKAVWLGLGIIPVAVGLGGLMVYITFKPVWANWLRRRRERIAGIHEPPADLKKEFLSAASSAPMRRVAIALDFSGRDAIVLRETVRLLGSQRPELGLMHVVESAPARFWGRDAGDRESKEDPGRLEGYALQLSRLGFGVRTFMGTGRPVEELKRMIRDFEADLVVLGAHGHRFLADLIYGATVDKLRHRIEASVLIVGKKGLH